MSGAGPVLLITGGSRGIGAATARLAAQAGYRLCLNYAHNQSAANQLKDELQADGAYVLCFQADVSDESRVLAMFAEIDTTFGRLDGLVNNAGILEPQSDLVDMDTGRWRRVLETNVIGSFICAREAVKRMRKQKNGAIVNLSSRAASLGAPHEYVDYAASKGAIDSMTYGLAKEVANLGIRVNAVRPGLIKTDIHASGGEPGRVERLQSGVPMQRGGTAEEVAETIIWLLSEKASYLTGTCIDVSGGR